jgi:hypothetical protein
MFDRLYVAPQSYPHYGGWGVSVAEKRAPTDASVSLLREMESAAQAKITEAIVVSDNKFECVIHKIHNFVDNRTIMRAVFLLNGIRMTAEYSEFVDHATPQSLATGIRDAIAKEVANAALDTILKAD